MCELDLLRLPVMSLDYEKRIVAYVDILGFKNMVADSRKNAEVSERIHNALKRIHKIVERNYSKGISNGTEFGIEVSTFSDNAVISYPAKEDNLFFLIIELIHLQLDLVIEGVLIRGGITIGDLYHDKDVVYGPAMVQAYEMENRIAVYPRIVVDVKAIVSYIEGIHGDTDAVKEIFALLRQDSDDLFFVDILNQSQEIYPEKRYYEWLTRIRAIIIEGLRNPNLYIRVKYQWLRNYFNKIVNNANYNYPYPYDGHFDIDDLKRVYSALSIE